MRKITIFCDGGLGNRFGVLIGGLITADVLNMEPVICWPENTWCGCSFEDLFDTNIEVIKNDINELFSNNLDKTFLIHENQTNLKLNKVFSHSENSLDTIRGLSEDVIYYHNQIPHYFGLSKVVNKLGSLKIQPEILDKVKSFSKDYGIDRTTNGIHFRKTDVPNQLDEDKIYQHIVQNVNSKFYICSDDKDTEMKFNLLQNTVVFPKTQYVEKLKDGGWNDLTTDNEGRVFNFNVNRPKQSVIEAFVDLLILSRTQILVNSVSSFLNFAKLYSNIEL
jgi:hypothetical protein